VSDQKPRAFDFTSLESLAASLHAQLLARRRATLEHDIKNVVHGLMSGTELLSKSLTATSARITPAECLTLLQQQLTRAQGTLNRMLDEVAPVADAAADIEIAEIVAECTHALRHQLQPFTVQVDVPQGIKLRGVRSRLKDALQFAVLDCVDRAPQRSPIAIVARSGESRGTLSIQHAEDAAQKPSPLLSIAPLLAPDDIRIDSEGNGTERTVRLSFPPLASEASLQLDLLIVDANRDGADSLVMLVQLEGFKAEACYDSASALEAIRSRTPRAIMVGLDGTLDGRALIRTIRNASARTPRIIGLSHGHLEPIAGLDVQLRMPLDLSALRRAME
jgi:hypothetical protein